VYLTPVRCPACGREGRPGEDGLPTVSREDRVDIHCQCGQVFQLESPLGQMVLSANPFARLRAVSNAMDFGLVAVTPGCTSEVRFAEPFDFVCRAFFTAIGVPIVVKELELRPDGMTIMSSFVDKGRVAENDALVSWQVYGLRGINGLPLWRVHFCSAVSQLENGLFKSALLDYAVAFEACIEHFLRQRFTARCGAKVAEHLLDKTRSAEERCTSLLKLASGHDLGDEPELLRSWKRHVQKPRNELAHGSRRLVDRDAAEQAHQAVYQAIVWIEHLAQES